MTKVRALISTLVWLLPAGTAKNRMLRRLGHDVDDGAHVASNLVRRVGHVQLAPGSRIGRFNVIKDVRHLSMGRDSSIGRMNLISAHPVFARLYPSGAVLVLEDHATITSRHSIDCAGGVRIGRYAILAGRRSTILTHSIDVRNDAQTAYPVTIGAYSFVSTCALILGGATLPDHSVLAAGAVLARTRTGGEPGLWAGVPARRVGNVDGAWFARTETHTRRVFIPETGESVENAF